MSLDSPPKALLTDVFGTVVDWRNTVNRHLAQEAHKALENKRSLSPEVRSAAQQTSWPDFAQEWRNSYYAFTRKFDPAVMQFKTIDDHHIDSLVMLVKKYHIEHLWDERELLRISQIWHHLDPWVDSSPGIALLSKTLKVGTLSNGNQTLLRDLAQHGNLAYTHFCSAEDYKAYKPHPVVYLSACADLDLLPSSCAMVAAHLGDLEAARQQGMQTIYIERVAEEAWGPGQIEEAKKWVDMWVSLGEGGFVEVARRLGLK